MHHKIPLTVIQSRMGQGINLFHASIGHGKAAYGNTAAMDHQGAAAVSVETIKGIGISQVYGQMELAAGIHLRRPDLIKTLGRTAVSFSGFGPEPF